MHERKTVRLIVFTTWKSTLVEETWMSWQLLGIFTLILTNVMPGGRSKFSHRHLDSHWSAIFGLIERIYKLKGLT